MKFIVLFIAIFITLCWVQMWIAAMVNAKINPYSNTPEDRERDIKESKVKMWLVFLSALFWSAFIIY